MTTPLLVNDLMRDEGLRLDAYLDSVGVLTIGYGHTGPELTPSMIWTQAEATDTLMADIAEAESDLDTCLPWWRTLDDVRQDCLLEMTFNLGIDGLLGFHHTLQAIQAGQWTLASAGMLLSKWAGQVGDRAQRIAFMMRNGTRAGTSPTTTAA